MRKSAIAALVAMLSVGAAPPLQAATQKDWENYMDAVAGGATAAIGAALAEILPPGVMDVVGVLNASPDVVKAGLILWLNKKMQQATFDDDMRRFDRYQNFQTCLVTHDCTKMRAMTNGYRSSF